MLRTLSLLLPLCYTLSCTVTPPPTQQEQTTDNLTAFSHLYGYVRYFHPSDAAADLDWDRFAHYGSERVADCPTPEALKQELLHLFRPVAPTLVIEEAKHTADPLPFAPAPDSTYIFWQHYGVDLEERGASGGAYQSQRVQLRDGVLQNNLFALTPARVMLTESLGSGLVCRLPLVLSETAAADNVMADSLSALEQRLEGYVFDVTDRASRLGNVVLTYATLQHFYPYFDVVDVDWQAELRTALVRSLTDSTEADHLLTLRRMTATLEDGHVGIYQQTTDYFPPVYWEWIGDTLTVTKVFEPGLGIAVGDVVTAIEGRSVTDHFADIWPTISTGTRGWLEYRSQRAGLSGAESTTLTLTVAGREVALTRTMILDDFYPGMAVNDDKFGAHDDGVLYVNLDLMPMEELDSLLPRLSQAAGLIFDLRGYPNDNDELITHFMASADTTSGWMQVPERVYPDRQSPSSFAKYNWIDFMQPGPPYLGDIPTVFLTDGRAISYAESFLGYIDHYTRATIMGQPTAGANGGVNTLHLPGDYTLRFTGMRVVKHNGSRLHGVGFVPDVLLTRTVAGVRRGEDEYVTAARAYLAGGE